MSLGKMCKTSLLRPQMDRSALIYMQSGSHGGPYDKMSGIDLKSSFVSKQGQSQPQSNGDSSTYGLLVLCICVCVNTKGGPLA